VTREGRSDHRRHADRVLVDVRLHVLGPDRVLARLQRDDPRLDVEVAAELLPHHMNVAAEDEVRLVGRLAGGLAPLAPLPLQGERAEHDRLGGTLCAGAGGLPGCVEELGEHTDAPLLDLRGHRVLGVIDEVAVEVLVDHLARLRLHPGGHEGGQVALRNPLDREFLLDQPHRLDGRHRLLGHPVTGSIPGQEPSGGPLLEGVVHMDLLARPGRRRRRPVRVKGIKCGGRRTGITRLG
jgi:hypothetical protein